MGCCRNYETNQVSTCNHQIVACNHLQSGEARSAPIRCPQLRQRVTARMCVIEAGGHTATTHCHFFRLLRLATGAASNPRPMLDFPKEQASASAAGASLPLYKHNSFDAADMFLHKEPAMVRTEFVPAS